MKSSFVKFLSLAVFGSMLYSPEISFARGNCNANVIIKLDKKHPNPGDSQLIAATFAKARIILANKGYTVLNAGAKGAAFKMTLSIWPKTGPRVWKTVYGEKYVEWEPKTLYIDLAEKRTGNALATAINKQGKLESNALLMARTLAEFGHEVPSCR